MLGRKLLIWSNWIKDLRYRFLHANLIGPLMWKRKMWMSNMSKMRHSLLETWVPWLRKHVFLFFPLSIAEVVMRKLLNTSYLHDCFLWMLHTSIDWYSLGLIFVVSKKESASLTAPQKNASNRKIWPTLSEFLLAYFYVLMFVYMSKWNC